MPSVASEVSATLSLPSAQRPSQPAPGSDSAPQPFASLLDATAPAPEPPPAPDGQNPSRRSDPASTQTGAHNDANSPITGPVADKVRDSKANPAAGETTNGQSAAKSGQVAAVGKGKANQPPHGAAKAIAGKASSPTAVVTPVSPGSTDFTNSTVSAAVGDKNDSKVAKGATKPEVDAQVKDAPAVRDAKDGKVGSGDDDAGPDASPQATTEPSTSPQPVAAAIVVANPVTTAAAPCADPAPDGAIDAGTPAATPAAPRSIAGLADDVKDAKTGNPKDAVAGDPRDAKTGDPKDATAGDPKDATAGDPKDAAAGDPKDAKTGDAKRAAASGNGNATAAPALAAPEARTAVASGSPHPADTNAQPPNDSGKLAKDDGTGEKKTQAAHPDGARGLAPPGSGHTDMRHAGSTPFDGQSETPTATSGPQSPNAVQANTDPVPNFGIAASDIAAAASSATVPATALPAAAPSAVAVPIAGLAIEIAARAQAGVNRFDIRLDPPELGRIDVRLDIDRDGRVTSHVTVDRSETLNLLQRDQPHLERALEQAGLKTADNGLQFTLRDHSFNGQDQGGRFTQNTARLVLPDPDLGSIETTSSRYRTSGVGGGVDISV